jgi:hypothetical protein
LIKLDLPALGRTTAKRGKSAVSSSGFLESLKASNKSPVPLPDILAKV